MAMELSGGPSSFINQGTIDWQQLAKSVVEFQVSFLGRLAAADIAPFTLLVGQNNSAIFRLSDSGRKRLIEGLKSLYSFSSVGQIVWFGFGIKHVVRQLAETDQGLTFITLCGCLSELHPTKACASILMELAEDCGAPSELRPSPHQWINMVDACSALCPHTASPRLSVARRPSFPLMIDMKSSCSRV